MRNILLAIGSTRFTTGSDGSRATTQRIGGFEYTTVEPPRGSRTFAPYRPLYPPRR